MNFIKLLQRLVKYVKIMSTKVEKPKKTERI